jgi:hypothetical protein
MSSNAHKLASLAKKQAAFIKASILVTSSVNISKESPLELPGKL